MKHENWLMRTKVESFSLFPWVTFNQQHKILTHMIIVIPFGSLYIPFGHWQDYSNGIEPTNSPLHSLQPNNHDIEVKGLSINMVGEGTQIGANDRSMIGQSEANNRSAIIS